MTAPEPEYDLFISYSTDPDYRLARSTEAFLESFHDIGRVGAVELRPLHVCRDGSDFIARPRGAILPKGNATRALIQSYLERSRYLLVICSRNAARSEWVREECEWFLTHHPDHILLAMGEGESPAQQISELVPAPLIDAGLHLAPWYDLRGFKGRAARRWMRVRGHEEEWVRLAAQLFDRSAGEIRPTWLEQREAAARRRARQATAVAVVTLALAVAATWAGVVARRNQLETQRTLAQSDFLVGAGAADSNVATSVAHLARALEYRPDHQAAARRLAMLLAQRRLPQVQVAAFAHTGRVTDLAFSEDGGMIATASEDSTVRFWDQESGRELRKPLRPGGPTWALTLMPGDRALVSTQSGASGEISLWETTTSRRVGGSYRHHAPVRRLLRSPRGDLAAAIGDDNVLLMLALADSGVRLLYQLANAEPPDVQFSSDGDRLLAATTGVTILDARSGLALHHLEPTGRWRRVRAAFTPDGARVIVAAGDAFQAQYPGQEDLYGKGGIQVWRARDGTAITPWTELPVGVEALAVSPAGDRAATAHIDGSITLWDLRNGGSSRCACHRFVVQALAFSPDDAWLASSSLDGTVRLWDVESGQALAAPIRDRLSFERVIVSPDASSIALLSTEGTASLWTLPTRPSLLPVPQSAAKAVSDASVRAPERSADTLRLRARALARRLGVDTADGHMAQSGAAAAFLMRDGSVRIWDLRTERETRRLALWAAPDRPSHLALGAGGRQLVVSHGGPDFKITVYDVATTRRLGSGSNGGAVTVMAFSPGDSLLATGTAVGSWQVWRYPSMAQVASGEHGGFALNAAVFSPDGRTLATHTLMSASVRLWDVETGRPLSDPIYLVGSSASIQGLAFGRDGSTLALTADNGVSGYLVDLCQVPKADAPALRTLGETLGGGQIRPGTGMVEEVRRATPRGAAGISGSQCAEWLASRRVDEMVAPRSTLSLSAWVAARMSNSDAPPERLHLDLQEVAPFNPIVRAAHAVAYAASDPAKARAEVRTLLAGRRQEPAVTGLLARYALLARDTVVARTLLAHTPAGGASPAVFDSLRAMTVPSTPAVHRDPATPAAVGVAQLAPGSSYELTAPDEWAFDGETAKGRGVQLLAYSAAATFANAPAVVYANSHKFDDHISDTEDFVQNTLRMFRSRGADITIGRREAWAARDAVKLDVVFFSHHPAYPAYEAAAYAEVDGRLIYIVYSAKSSTTFARDLPKFREMATSLRLVRR